jgi:hypothetical protein
MRPLPLLLAGAFLASVGLAATLTRSSGPPSEAPTDLALQANGVAEWLEGGVESGQFSTGSALFDAEWVFGTSQMAALGFAQQAIVEPERRAEALLRMETAIDGMLSENGRAFDRQKWGEDALESLAGGRGHAAWLGYTNLALSVHRELVPDSKYASLNDKISDAVAARVLAAPHGVFETYPSERYPVDNAAGIASLILHDRLTGRDHTRALSHWRESLAVDQRDPGTGLLFQMLDEGGLPRMNGRGSGTFLSAWFLSFGDPALACEIYGAGRDELLSNAGPIDGMREYPRGVDGPTDIDSGPIVAGLGLSSTGFAIGAARACGDEEVAAALTRTATLFGAPHDEEGARHWRSGQALGGAPVADAILFAMMSTPGRIASSAGDGQVEP